MTKRRVTGHYIAHWGVPREVRVAGHAGWEVAVLEFHPGDRLDGYRYATNGMHEYPQQYGDRSFRTELYVATRQPCTWVEPLLRALVPYPQQPNTALGTYDTLAVGGPVDRAHSSLTALLFAPPDPASLALVGGATSEPVILHRVVGLTERECRFAMEQGGEALWERLRGSGSPLYLDEPRAEVV